jgi:hypothetical protein
MTRLDFIYLFIYLEQTRLRLSWVFIFKAFIPEQVVDHYYSHNSVENECIYSLQVVRGSCKPSLQRHT